MKIAFGHHMATILRATKKTIRTSPEIWAMFFSTSLSASLSIKFYFSGSK